jgi:hypothetical protein
MLNYQGRVSVNGTNFTGSGNFKFALVSSGRNDNRQATGIAQRAGKFIWGVQITDGGAGYSSAPAVRIVGGGGSGAQAIATVSNGAITWIEVFNPGNNYTGTPTVEIDPPQENLTHTTFWSHDGTSANGFAPASAVTVAAEKGIFSTLIGGSGMQPVPENVFTNESVYLRVWFSSGGTNSFEQLLPDQRIATVGYAMKSKNAGTAALAENAVNASNAQNAEIAYTVADGAITSAKIAANSITAEKLAAGVVGSTALAAGSVSGWQVLGSNPVTAAPNTKYLMPEDGSGILTLPATPSPGATILVSGRGKIRGNTNQLISGLWMTAGTNFAANQLLVSEDGRAVLAYNSTAGILRVIRAGAAAAVDYPVPTSTNPVAGGTLSRISMSGDASRLLGFFQSSDSSTQGLYVSANYGESWNKVTLPDAMTNLTQFNSVASSSDGNTLYAVGADGGTMSNTIVKSLDAGLTWQVPGILPEGYSSIGWSNSFLVSDNGRTLVTSGSGSNGVALLRSTNGGSNWTMLDVKSTATNYWYVYLDKVTMSGDGMTLAIPGGGSPAGERVLVTSRDGGNSWTRATTYPTEGGVSYGDALHSLTSNGAEIYSLASSMYTSSIVESSSDFGRIWHKVFQANSGSYGYSSNRQLATDATGTQVAFTDINHMGTSSKIYVSAGDELSLEQRDSSVELVYRGDGRWLLISQKNATASLGGGAPPAPSPTPFPTPPYYPYP